MIVFMTLIPDASLEDAKRLTRDLESVFQSGDVERSDALSSELRAMFAGTNGVTAAVPGERPVIDFSRV